MLRRIERRLGMRDAKPNQPINPDPNDPSPNPQPKPSPAVKR
jgi:hypothetical protein